jgi:polyvinyl alcohol dehydrogenase (cytochrome)
MFPTGAATLGARREEGQGAVGHKFSDYGLPANTNSRTSPAVSDGVVYVGTQEAPGCSPSTRRRQLIWKTQLESAANDPFAIVTASPVVCRAWSIPVLHRSKRVSLPILPIHAAGRAAVSGGQCHDRTDPLAHLYRPTGYSGGGVWGSNLAVDRARGSVFVGTGNNYAIHRSGYIQCVANGGTAQACTSPANHVDAVLALNTQTGAIKWAYKA